MNIDRFERLLHEAGQAYHPPPQTPRDELWASIDAERRRRRAAPRVVLLRPGWQWGLGMAAVLLLGIIIGRSMRPGSGPRAAATAVPVAGAPSNLAYGMAAAQVLNRTETLLAGFRADARTGQLDLQFVTQARDLLSSTRLLLDSPAGRDPRLKPLLEDLELILAQIASLTGVQDAQDVELINQGIDQRSVFIRLRTAIPSGPVAAARAQGVL